MYIDPEEGDLFHPAFSLGFHRNGSTYSIRIIKSDQYARSGPRTLCEEDLHYLGSFLDALLNGPEN